MGPPGEGAGLPVGGVHFIAAFAIPTAFALVHQWFPPDHADGGIQIDHFVVRTEAEQIDALDAPIAVVDGSRCRRNRLPSVVHTALG